MRILPFLAIFAAAQATARPLVVLHDFTSGADGSSPQAAVIAGPDAALYGTTGAGGTGACLNPLDIDGCGTVFRLAPPAAGGSGWIKTTLHDFANQEDGSDPMSALLRDSNGNLYGTTYAGGVTAAGTPCERIGCGIVYRLSPPVAGQTAWTKTTLYAFTGGKDGAFPMAGLIANATGALFGTTSIGGGGKCSPGCGTVFRLRPPAGGNGPWQKTTLYEFPGGPGGFTPAGALLAGKDGSLFGTTVSGGPSRACTGGCGTAFRLDPPVSGQTAWQAEVLHIFLGQQQGARPACALISDAAGALYGTAEMGGGAPFNGGTVFRLQPPSSGGTVWTFSLLHRIGLHKDGDLAGHGVIRGADGRLYGTTQQGSSAGSGGVAYALAPSAGGGAPWHARILNRFEFGSASLNNPGAPLLLGADGALYGTSLGVGSSTGAGTVFALTP